MIKYILQRWYSFDKNASKTHDKSATPANSVNYGYMVKSKYLATCSCLSLFCKSKSPNIDDFTLSSSVWVLFWFQWPPGTADSLFEVFQYSLIISKWSILDGFILAQLVDIWDPKPWVKGKVMFIDLLRLLRYDRKRTLT